MGARFRSWWKQIKRPSVIGIIAVSVLLVVLIVVEIRFYGTGFAGKTRRMFEDQQSYPYT